MAAAQLLPACAALLQLLLAAALLCDLPPSAACAAAFLMHELLGVRVASHVVMPLASCTRSCRGMLSRTPELPW